jgi:hypothetical protein
MLNGLSPLKGRRHPNSFHQDTKVRIDTRNYMSDEKKQGSARSADKVNSHIEENAKLSEEGGDENKSDNPEKSLSIRVKGITLNNNRDS